MIKTLCTGAFVMGLALACRAETQAQAEIKAFCIDFNWGGGGTNGFAKSGLWADADPAEHFAWYKALGVNVIQTFAVSCNGYAWYKRGVVPEQPGLKSDFLKEMVALGHSSGMRVMGDPKNIAALARVFTGLSLKAYMKENGEVVEAP